MSMRKMSKKNHNLLLKDATSRTKLKGTLSLPGNDIYGLECHAGSTFENYTVNFKFSDF